MSQEKIKTRVSTNCSRNWVNNSKFLGKKVYQPYKNSSQEQEKRDSSKTHCLGLAQTQYKTWQGGDENGKHSIDVNL